MSSTTGVAPQTRSFPPWLGRLAVTASIVLAVAWAVYRSTPMLLSEDFLRYAIRWPFLDAPEGTDFMRSSPTGMIVFHLLGGSGRLPFVLLHLIAISITTGALAWWTMRYSARASRVRSLRFVILSPVAAVLLQSIGGYDSFTLLGIVLVLFGWSLRSTLLLVVGSVYLGFQHFEQAVVLSAVWWLAYMALQSKLPASLQGLRSPLWILPGVLVGKLVLTLTLAAYGAPAFGTRAAAFFDWMGIAASIAVNRLPMTLWGGFAGLWVVLLLTSASLPRRRVAQLALAVVLALAFSTTTIDNLRVFVMLTVPITALLIVVANNQDYLQRAPIRVATEGLMWLGLPQPTSTYALNNLHAFLLQLRSLAG